MITRDFKKGDAHSSAIYSDCQRYRYQLTRIWEPTAGKALFIMLNPSTATEIQNDPTVERCERRARALGFGSFRVTNIFAWRDTDPRNMKAAKEPIGQENDNTITESCHWANRKADRIICGWGTHGEHLNRGPQVEQLIRATGLQSYHLGLTKAGHPKHPLYIAYSQQPILWLNAQRSKYRS